MRGYKRFDFISQFLLILIIIPACFFDNEGAITSVSIISIGILQIISLLAHAVMGKQGWKENTLRKIHLIATGVVILIMLYGFFKPAKYNNDLSGLGIIVYALIPGAVVALFYTYLTFVEWKKFKRRN